jgi:hypothetical protein
MVSVNILSFNRKDQLRLTLQKVFKQDYKKIEVIVVDNASTDGTVEMIEKDFPQVHFIRLNKNIGIAGWNRGFEIAKGEYILMLDDDAYPENSAIHKSISEFSDENVASITFNLINTNNNKFYEGSWLPKQRSKKRFWPVFVGCAFMVKKDRLPEYFLFPENYFIYQHELPMAAEIHLNNKNILFSPEIIAYHKFKNTNTYNSNSDSLVFKNNLQFICSYLPGYLMVLYSLQSILFYFTRSLRHKWFKKYLKIILNNKFILKTKPISANYFFQLRKLHLFNYPLWTKIFKK